jgi:Short C-terminal domain
MMPMLRRRRPVLRAAGAAAVGGALYRAGRRSGSEAASEVAPAEGGSDPTVAGSPEQALSAEAIDQLRELGRLHKQGVLTDEEFEQQKQRYLQ